MKSKIIEKEETPKPDYPKLMISEWVVVLFYSIEKGTVAHKIAGSGYYVGYHSASWDMSNFKDFHGTIELSN